MSKLIGDRKFYKKVLTVAVPIMIQNGISNFVSLLDNIMIGSVGTESMSGVSIVNQLMFVLYLALFGALARYPARESSVHSSTAKETTRVSAIPSGTK